MANSKHKTEIPSENGSRPIENARMAAEIELVAVACVDAGTAL